jgi:hypothetical protein
MGQNFIDQYSLLHFASGIMFYFLGINFNISIFIHTLFEIIENIPLGTTNVYYLHLFWLGGRNEPDTFLNSVGDTVIFALGFLTSRYIDKVVSSN